MYKTVPGTFRSGIVYLAELSPDLPEGRVLVTFLETAGANPANHPGLTPEQIVELRGKLAAWEGDWSAPGMELYDKP